MAGLATAEDEMSLYLNDFNRLYLSLIQWMRLVSYLMEINIHQVRYQSHPLDQTQVQPVEVVKVK